MSDGYYRFPTIAGETIVFVSEDDLWTVSTEGGIARRLTAGLGEVTCPVLDPTGKLLAFTGREEGTPEVYLMPAEGGVIRRLTFQGAAMSQVVGWEPSGQRIVFASSAGQPFDKVTKLYAVDKAGGLPELLPLGEALNISFGPNGGVVLGRNTRDPARWKRYRGGTCGVVWIDKNGKGLFNRLAQIDGNMASPMWIGQRIYFLSDHEGIGNVYSCRPSGKDLQRHTHHGDYYARNAATDGVNVVYHAGADIFKFNPATDESRKVDVRLNSPRTQRNRKFVSAAKNLESYALHPQGGRVALVSRGKPFAFANWEGPALRHGELNGVRYRLATWLADGEQMVATSDENGEERLIVFRADGGEPPNKLPQQDIGRPLQIAASPTKPQVVLHNQRGQLIFVDLKTHRLKVLDESQFGRLAGICWSPDGRWVAYAINESHHTSVIRLCRVSSGKVCTLTQPVLYDLAPSFDPDGKYLYFLSHRVFDPVYDNLHFDLNFPRGMKPYLITLQSDTPSPFCGETNQINDDKQEGKDKSDSANGTQKDEPLRIDLDGIQNRVVAIPMPEGKYGQIRGLKNNKVLLSSFPVEGSLDQSWTETTPKANGTLEFYDLVERKQETWASEISTFDVSADCQMLIYRSGNRLRVVKATEKPNAETAKEPAGRKSGWLDLGRLKLSVNPPDEWRQMYDEAWRLQRDHFWTEDMSGVEWQMVYDRYLPLLDRVTTRSEFSDLMWEMQGELGTSHAYELGGDYRKPPQYKQGFLGADFSYDRRRGGYRITQICQGDPWDEDKASPLGGPGINIAEGDVLLAIGGQPLDERVTPHELLVHQAGGEIVLTVAKNRGAARTVTVKTLKNETPLRYRDWVEANRSYVHDKTKGRVGYVHIPNMGPLGYSEFHRYYLVEAQRDALLVDVRFNGGGHVSQLILEKLMRRRVGYFVPRWQQPESYPEDSVLGPIVALTNEKAGSDGDIFSHCFKLLKIGPLIGKRTWGGVIGIWPRHPLVDGSITTQPEFSMWLEDVGWGVENYGTEPDIEVDIAPHDDAANKDPQLDRGIQEIKKLLKSRDPRMPEFEDRPKLAIPKLPPAT